MPQQKLWILFFGRLDDEKWFWLILQALNMFIKKFWWIPFSFYIFWKWKYEKDLLDLWQKYSSIHFFGWQPLETIKKYKDNCQFCLMPSTFLETFWLTAVNALSMWIPVIWFAKWWLKQFIQDKYDISQYEWDSDEEKVYNTLISIIKLYNEDKINIEKEKKKALDMAKHYTIENRFKNVEPILWKPKKILLVSDFKSKLGWIETYIHDVRDILQQKWYEVEIFWTNIPSGKIWKLLRYFWLWFALRNFVDALRLKKKLRTFMPKIVRFNSTLRWIWWYPIKIASQYNAKKIMMYHDLWYFHPYPSLVTQENMVINPLSLKNFIKSAHTKNPIKIISIIFKYFSVCLLSKQLKNTIDIHLVPSEFLQEIVCNSFEISPKKVQVLQHFIQN